MYTDTFEYKSSYEVLPEVLNKMIELFDVVNFRQELLDKFEKEKDCEINNYTKQDIMEIADKKVVKKIEDTLVYLREIEMFDTLFSQ